MSDERFKTSTWLVVLHEIERRQDCICGGRRGHAGWLICAERKVAEYNAVSEQSP